MADHIFGFGKKVITDSSGTLYDSGGPQGPYNANEEDYFIIRRTAAEYSSEQYFILTFAEWDVLDRNVSTSYYDFIDVYRENTNGQDPSKWVWIERIGGVDLNGASVVATFHLSARNIKFVFRSNFRQNYTYNGFKLNFSTSNSTSGTDLQGVGSTSYSDELNLKENGGDASNVVLSEIESNPGSDNWDFIPNGQFSEDMTHAINTLKHQFTNFNYTLTGGAPRVPRSYTQPERGVARKNSENVSNIRRKKG